MTGDRDAFRERLAGWCMTALDILSDGGRLTSYQSAREITERHRGSLKVLLAMAAEIDVNLAEGSPRRREIAGDALMSRYGIPVGTFRDRRLKRLMRVLARGRANNEDELRLLIDYASDLENPAGLRDQCDALVAAYEPKPPSM